MEEEKKGIVTREIDKFRETMKIREAEKEEQDKKRKGSKSPSRRKSKSRERDSESRSRLLQYIIIYMGQIPQDGENEQYVALFFNF